MRLIIDQFVLNIRMSCQICKVFHKLSDPENQMELHQRWRSKDFAHLKTSVHKFFLGNHTVFILVHLLKKFFDKCKINLRDLLN